MAGLPRVDSPNTIETDSTPCLGGSRVRGWLWPDSLLGLGWNAACSGQCRTPWWLTQAGPSKGLPLGFLGVGNGGMMEVIAGG